MSVFASGCGSDSVQVADTSPAATGVPVDDKGVDETGPDPRADEIAMADKHYLEWLRSDYVKTLDPKSLKKQEDWGIRLLGPRTFDEAVDKADSVVSGVVEGLLFVPYGTLTTFRVDRTAKGERKATINVLQTSHVQPDENDQAEQVYDPAASLLAKGDRAVLLLKKFPATELMPEQKEFLGEGFRDPVYMVLRGSGQYRSEGGMVRTEKANSVVPNPDESFDGRSEDALMDAAETRAKKDGATP